MKNYIIHCIILDKLNPESEDPVQSIELYTNIEAVDEQSAINSLNNTYNIQKLIYIEEIL